MLLPQLTDRSPNQLIFLLAYYSRRLISDTSNIASLHIDPMIACRSEQVSSWVETLDFLLKALENLALDTQMQPVRELLERTTEALESKRELPNAITDELDAEFCDLYEPGSSQIDRKHLSTFVSDFDLKKIRSRLDDLVLEEECTETEYVESLRRLRNRMSSAYSDFQNALSKIKSVTRTDLTEYFRLADFLGNWRDTYFLDPQLFDSKKISNFTELEKALSSCKLSEQVRDEAKKSIHNTPVLSWFEKLVELILQDLSFMPLYGEWAENAHPSLASNSNPPKAEQSVAVHEQDGPICLYGKTIVVQNGQPRAILRALIAEESVNRLRLAELIDFQWKKAVAEFDHAKIVTLMKRVSPILNRLKRALENGLGLKVKNILIRTNGIPGKTHTSWKLNLSEIEAEIANSPEKQGTSKFNAPPDHTQS